MTEHATAPAASSTSNSSGPPVMGVVLLLMAAALAVGGVWLAGLGGSWYYVLAAIGLAISGVLLFRRSPHAPMAFALLLAASAAWAVWEVGLDWWPLAARLDVFFVVGLVLLTPWVARALPRARRSNLALGVVVGAMAVLAVVSGLRDGHQTVGAFASAPAAGAAPQDAAAADVPPGEWQAYGRTGYGQRYSPLGEFTPANVASLRPAWQFRTGDVRGRPDDPEETTYEVTPLKVGNRLFLCTPHQAVIALDATTGRELWRYVPRIESGLALQHLTCRGVSYQPPPTGVTALAASAPGTGVETSGRASEPVAAAAGPTTTSCPAKLFMATADARLIALNPDTGAVCRNFGGGSGQVDLWAHMPNVMPGSYYSTSPVVVTRHLARNLVVVGGTVLDNYSTKEPSGVIRAFDAETGALVWNWDAGHPAPTTPVAAGQTYSANSPNSWSVSSVDEALGLVYVPMGNQPPDQWGGQRNAATEASSSAVVALDLATGQPRWIFQTVHHDLWDYDVPSQPSLVDLRIEGRTVPALVQPTKQGELFVLDRRTGTPLLPVREQPAPQGAAAGDHTAPTQPKSALSFDPPRLTGADMWGGTIFDQLACRIAFHRLRYEGRFTPPSTQGSLVYPGNFGVFNWGAVAVDPVRQIAFTTPTYLAFVSRLVPRTNDKALVLPGAVPAPPHSPLPSLNENFGAPFAAQLGAFLSPLGVPCQAPPWGYVAGADLRTGQVVWMHKNGTVRDLSPLPLPFRMGVPDLGGPLITAGGVAFLSGSMDDYVRAYDVNDGRQLWQSRLPAGGQATPMTYVGSDGREYLVVVAGGHGSTHTKAGDYVIGYALERR